MQRYKVTRIGEKVNAINAKLQLQSGARIRFSEAKVETKDKIKFPCQGPNFQEQVHSRGN